MSSPSFVLAMVAISIKRSSKRWLRWSRHTSLISPYNPRSNPSSTELPNTESQNVLYKSLSHQVIAITSVYMLGIITMDIVCIFTIPIVLENHIVDWLLAIIGAYTKYLDVEIVIDLTASCLRSSQINYTVFCAICSQAEPSSLLNRMSICCIRRTNAIIHHHHHHIIPFPLQ